MGFKRVYALFSGVLMAGLVACGVESEPGGKMEQPATQPTESSAVQPYTQPTDELVYQPFVRATNPPEQPATPPAPNVKGTLAPAIQSDTWLNVDAPIAWGSLRGKVVMVEFWTFDCINCQHVIPQLESMYEAYQDKGFVLIGVHSPELSFERVLENVRNAVVDEGIRYPVAIDNDFANWNRYNNLFWPALYLVDKQGILRYRRIGEGGYAETRQWIESLLAE